MSRTFCAVFVAIVVAAVSGCSGGTDAASGTDVASGAEAIEGPFPRTVQGGISYSYPLEDGSGDILLGLYEHAGAAIIVSAATYDAKGMEDDDAEVSLSITPAPREQCGDAAQCFRGE